MKNIATFLLSFLLLLPTGSFAQKKFNPHKVFTAGHASTSLGIGLIPTYLMDGASIVLPPLSVGVDYLASDIVSIGIQLGHSQSLSKRAKDGAELVKEYYNYTTQLGLRLAAHCNRWESWDFYGGFLLGYQFTNIKPTTGSIGPEEKLRGIMASTSHVVYSGFLGMRYSCCGRISFFGEAGYGISLLQAGSSYHF